MSNKNEDQFIYIKGAKTHNLKNISLKIPRNKLTVISGLSGSGKSSLAFDTIFAEGQRRYVESLSAYARQFLNQMQKPEVDEIKGLTPAISIDQKSRSNNPRSTVATITEIYDYLRVMYATVGKPHCLECGREISKLSVDEIYLFIQKKIQEKIKEIKKDKKEIPEGINLSVYAVLVKERKGQYYQMLYDLLSKGFSYVRVDGKICSLREKIDLKPNSKHTIELLVDQFYLEDFLDKNAFDEQKPQIIESVEKTLELSEDKNLLGVFQDDLKLLKTKTKKEEKQNEFLLSAKFACPYDGYSYEQLHPRNFSFNSPVGACEACGGLGFEAFFSENVCKICSGNRLKSQPLSVFLGDEKSQTSPIKDSPNYKGGLNIVDITNKTIKDAILFFDNLKLKEKEEEIVKLVLKEIKDRLKFLSNVGLEYITLSRNAYTLSGGEAQRIRLASQLGSGLVGATYVLDEPTIGLHSVDNDRLIKTLIDMKDMGNTVIVVEHDEDVIFSADYLVDIGPFAGEFGGEVIVADDLDKLISAKTNASKSRTLAYLRGETKIEVPQKRKTAKKGKVEVIGANVNNISNENISFPIGKIVAITGVSGSGKSTFMHKVLYKNLEKFHQKKNKKMTKKDFQNCAEIKGLENFARTILINQSPIGKTPRSNPATYTGAFTHIRDLFAQTTESKIRGYKSGRFSFNVEGGRCEACSGHGYVKVEMHFMADVYVKCDVCLGKRFSKETLEVKYKDKNISEVLDMSIQKAYEFFKDIPAVADRLKALNDVGLSYLKLGQSATTLSGGEAQRVKIASELYRPFTQKTIYLLDEPTVGLHYDDVAKLNKILNILTERGNTVVVIEHNLDLIKISDYILDFGPKGGEEGGKVVAKGTPEEVAENKNSQTAPYLKRVLKK
ncbi:excinuclease ABC subunit A [Candidatus Campbellbacteria bacterium]|nr:MAG: excinuclease ABC subunit A [Candidatus Campbellbacteria bacterium]